MTSHERWKEIDDRFREALELSEDRRSAFLDDLSAEDEELRRSVEALLRAAEESAPFLEGSVDQSCAPPWGEVFEFGATRDDPDQDDRSGERVGPYRLVRRIGRGGMATVYLAERADGLWEQEVALKLIRRGLDTEDVVRRFVAERQILSTLRHPNIASLLDGGTTADGLPYLVMEYVEGTPITDYCDRHRLTVDERLRVFCAVARAVQDAHRSLIVHRDLKPSNILVTEERRVKLLDFGIAKLLDRESDPESAGFTRPGHRPLTPEYASPEQMAGGPITTASDIYQLGVLLYRLLCGERPHGTHRDWSLGGRRGPQRASPAPPSRVLDREPTDAPADGVAAALASRRDTTPERLSRRLQGDLDTIVAKAMRPEPDERYDSVGALVEDVERHLEQLPIRARAPTRRYRLRKFLKRNAWVGPVTAAALLGVGLYAFSMDRQARALERQRNAAQAEAARAEAIQGFMTDLFRSPDPFAPADPERGRRITVVEALEIGTGRVRSELTDQPGLQADLFAAIADVYRSLDLEESESRLRRDALERAREAHGPGSTEVALRLRELGSALAIGEGRDSAESVLLAALALTRERVGDRDTAYARVLAELGHLAFAQGRHEDAVRYLEQAVAIVDSTGASAPELAASSLGGLAAAYPHVDRAREGIEAARRSVNLYRSTLGPEHPRTALAMVWLGDAYDWIEEPERAVEQYRSALPIMERTLGSDHIETVGAMNNLAVSLLRAGQPERAEDVLRRLVEIRTAKSGERHESVADALQNLAATLNQQGELDEAEATLSRAHEIYVDVLEPGHFRVAYPLLTLTAIRLERSDFVGAEEAASEATRILRRSLPEGHYATAVAECRWGRALVGLGRSGAATPLLERAADVLLTAPRADRHEEECLRAALDHLRGIGASRDRWGRFAERLSEIEARVSAPS